MAGFNAATSQVDCLPHSLTRPSADDADRVRWIAEWLHEREKNRNRDRPDYHQKQVDGVPSQACRNFAGGYASDSPGRIETKPNSRGGSLLGSHPWRISSGLNSCAIAPPCPAANSSDSKEHRKRREESNCQHLLSTSLSHICFRAQYPLPTAGAGL